MSRFSACAGSLVARTPLCRLDLIRTNDGNCSGYSKVRLRYSAALLRVARLAPWISPNVRGLRLTEWIPWEVQAWRVLHGVEITTVPRGIVTPVLSGIKLSELLRSQHVDAAEKLRAFRVALDALRRAHDISVRWPDGSIQTFSHGDAHVGNVMVNVGAERACWFDFETIHTCTGSSAWRRADDLRAFAWSAAASCDPEIWPQIVSSVRDACSGDVCKPLLHITEAILRTGRIHWLHYSQAPMAHRSQVKFAAALWKELTLQMLASTAL